MTEFRDATWSGSGKWQKHHVIPGEVFKLGQLRALFAGLAKNYNQEDFDTNGIFLPEDASFFLASGFAKHSGSHPAFTTIITGMLDVILAKMNPSIRPDASEA